ncbi:MAG TPA: hypothetical protein VFE62_24155 [Gemmataceae bacterium]|nr:hypothetical protein [Gemmataceae bacterium]
MRTLNALIAGMGALLLLVAGWIGNSASHIPTIEQKLEDFMTQANGIFSDHEARIRILEGRRNH